MENMMVMEWKLGLEGAGIEGSIGRDLDMVLGCIDFTQGMFMQGNGLMARVMGAESILVKTEVGTSGNSSGVSSMDLATTISGNI